MGANTRNGIWFVLFWTKVAVSLLFSLGGLFYLSWRIYDLHRVAVIRQATATSNSIGIIDPSTGQAYAKCAYTDATYARLEPNAQSMLLGYSLNWQYTFPQDVINILSDFSPPVYNVFMDFGPTQDATIGFDNSSLNWFGSLCGKTKSMLELTLQPESLTTITDAMFEAMATELRNVNQNYAVPIFLRYGHEMNGNWPVYGYQPTAFKASFIKMANAVRAKTNMTAMVWAPNVGITYPFGASVIPLPTKGTADFTAMDTNGDGEIDSDDDPYTPYYPGNQYVDWVGLSLYYYPFEDCYNCAVYSNYFQDYLTGQGNVTELAVGTLDATYIKVHNFYNMFSNSTTYDKPLMLPETAAPYFTNMTATSASVSETAIKSGWWKQVLGDNSIKQFPRLKMAVNFEEEKVQTPFGSTPYLADWRVLNTSSQLAMWKDVMSSYNGKLLQTSDLTYGCDGSVTIST
ncbi:hypothetical protein HDU84_002014 [Entophlyctis sp. JEL0112]|nr:hypothetical protein HDU84_002014 [Entophlyctis sp. JEL0112]